MNDDGTTFTCTCDSIDYHEHFNIFEYNSQDNLYININIDGVTYETGAGGCIENISLDNAKIICNDVDECDGFFMKDSSASVSRVCFKTNINLESGLNSGESYLERFQIMRFLQNRGMDLKRLNIMEIDVKI